MWSTLAATAGWTVSSWGGILATGGAAGVRLASATATLRASSWATAAAALASEAAALGMLL